MKYLIIAQLFFMLGVFAQPEIKAYFTDNKEIAKDESGYEAVLANIDSGEIYRGK